MASRRTRKYYMSDRYAKLLTGELKIEDLDDEEIIKGRIRAEDGSFRGAPPKLIPYSLHQALKKSMTDRMERKMIESLPEVIDALVKIATAGAGVDPKARVAAGTFLIERTIGKAPDKLELEETITHRWEEAASEGRLFVDISLDEAPDSSEPVAQPTAITQDIIDAELVDDHVFEAPVIPEEPGSDSVFLITPEVQQPPKPKPTLKKRPKKTGVIL